MSLTKILILFLLLLLFQSLREVAVLMSLLVFISEPIRKRSKHRGKGRGWLKVEGSPLGPTVKASCLAPH